MENEEISVYGGSMFELVWKIFKTTSGYTSDYYKRTEEEEKALGKYIFHLAKTLSKY